ncbi:hypothetical protein FJR45_09540 [Sulfurimonas sediminis]|uniref:Uncharacterized protein n=1 Tax=Sulfurimonas sediminis TaxID=2590020 RepID=A0A7M1B367_9BACT|nr:hypothetical protein [Sulfurimonas sediminis]QOP44171.1 hypothetical protein FJR45_09540 [Sulfurimonas sediminis]
MIKIYLLILFTLLFNGCVNKHGISAKYYSDCKEYYDFQGYYHKECGDDDIITYETMDKELQKATKKVKSLFVKEKPPVEKNVW